MIDFLKNFFAGDKLEAAPGMTPTPAAAKDRDVLVLNAYAADDEDDMEEDDESGGCGSGGCGGCGCRS